MKLWFNPLAGSTNADLREAFRLTEGGMPRDLTAAELKMGIADKTAVRLLLTDASGLDVTDAADGSFEVVITAAQMATLGPGEFRHDLLLIDDEGTRRIWTGTLTIERGVTPNA